MREEKYDKQAETSKEAKKKGGGSTASSGDEPGSRGFKSLRGVQGLRPSSKTRGKFRSVTDQTRWQRGMPNRRIGVADCCFGGKESMLGNTKFLQGQTAGRRQYVLMARAMARHIRSYSTDIDRDLGSLSVRPRRALSSEAPSRCNMQVIRQPWQQNCTELPFLGT